MKYLFITLLFVSAFSSCKKTEQEPECVNWKVSFFEESKSTGYTVTSNYLPYDVTTSICGAGKDTVFVDKKVILSETTTTRHCKIFRRKL